MPSIKKNNLPTKDISNFNQKARSRIHLSDRLRYLRFKVVNIANYFQNVEKLVEHLNEVNFYFL